MLNVVCINAFNYQGRGEEYVQKLRAGVERNLTLPYRFHALTESNLPYASPSWWSKLALFHPEAPLPRGERALFLDLDTVIVGSLDEIGAYQGPFAGIADLLNPNRFGSSVMAWTIGENGAIWSTWERAGKPDWHPQGDQCWIEAIVPDAERLQRHFPGQIVSAKLELFHAHRSPDPRIVCFHGQPRPHALKDLMEHW